MNKPLNQIKIKIKRLISIHNEFYKSISILFYGQ